MDAIPDIPKVPKSLQKQFKHEELYCGKFRLIFSSNSAGEFKKFFCQDFNQVGGYYTHEAAASKNKKSCPVVFNTNDTLEEEWALTKTESVMKMTKYGQTYMETRVITPPVPHPVQKFRLNETKNSKLKMIFVSPIKEKAVPSNPQTSSQHKGSNKPPVHPGGGRKDVYFQLHDNQDNDKDDSASVTDSYFGRERMPGAVYNPVIMPSFIHKWQQSQNLSRDQENNQRHRHPYAGYSQEQSDNADVVVAYAGKRFHEKIKGKHGKPQQSQSEEDSVSGQYACRADVKESLFQNAFQFSPSIAGTEELDFSGSNSTIKQQLPQRTSKLGRKVYDQMEDSLSKTNIKEYTSQYLLGIQDMIKQLDKTKVDYTKLPSVFREESHAHSSSSYKARLGATVLGGPSRVGILVYRNSGSQTVGRSRNSIAKSRAFVENWISSVSQKESPRSRGHAPDMGGDTTRHHLPPPRLEITSL